MPCRAKIKSLPVREVTESTEKHKDAKFKYRWPIPPDTANYKTRNETKRNGNGHQKNKQKCTVKSGMREKRAWYEATSVLCSSRKLMPVPLPPTKIKIQVKLVEFYILAA